MSRTLTICCSIVGIAGVVLSGLACGLFDNANSSAGMSLLQGGGLVLRLENQSGLPAEVVIAFEATGQPTRDSRRLLAASGPEATQTLLWTQADRVSVTARVAPATGGLTALAKVGDLLAAQEYQLNVDYQAGDTIVFVIPAPTPGPEPFLDCNSNGISDFIDIAARTSFDCNGNGIPDECDIRNGTAQDTNGNGVPDSCELGACCLQSGSCQDLIPSTCTSLGGTYRGAGSACASITCSQPPPTAQACCFGPGDCSELLPGDCVYRGGQPQGPGTTCPSAACPPLLEACCLPDKTCQDLTPSQCDAGGGIGQGPETTCSTTTCPIPLEACCFSDLTCSDLLPVDCRSLGGTPKGSGTDCSSITCPPPPTEACCLSSGGCSDLTAEECSLAGGTPQGAGSSCTGTTCPAVPTVACCFPGASCSDLTPADCLYWGGDSQGPGSICAATECPDTVACCFSDGTCDDLPAPTCYVLGGAPGAPGSRCLSTDCPYRRVYVNTRATGANDGSSWPDAYTDLQSALAEAAVPENLVLEIWVAAGLYVPTGRLEPEDPRSATFVMAGAVQIYGGFAGHEELLQERDLSNSANTTTLSGDVGTPEVPSDNAYHVVTAFMNQSTGRLDGFTIQDGLADNSEAPGPVPAVYGGGLYVVGGSPKIVNCRFINNHALMGGGGLCVDGTNSAGFPTWVVNCSFFGNSTFAYSSSSGGGGMLVTGEFAQTPVHVALMNCLFDGNFAGGLGGGLYANASALYPLSVVNCTFTGNNSEYPIGHGAALYMSARLANSIIWGNGWNGYELSQLDASPGTITVAHSCIEGWTGALDPDGPSNITSDPQFVNPLGPDTIPGTPDDDLRLNFGSLSIDAGSSTYVAQDLVDLDHDGDTLELVPLDFDLRPRFQFPPTPVIDMGAYEFQGV